MTTTTPAPAETAAETAYFVCRPNPDGTRAQALLFHPDEERLLLPDELNPTSADARAALLDRFGEAAAIAGYAFDRAAAEADLIARAGEMMTVSGPAGAADPAATLARLGLAAVGVREDGSVVVHSAATGRTRDVSRPAKLEFEDALQLIGPDRTGRLVRKRDRESPPGAISLRELKEALALAAASAPEIRGGGRGRGVWPGEGDGLLVNDGAAVYVYDGAATADLDGHAVGGRPVLRGGGEWAGPAVRAALDGMTPARAAGAYDRLLALTAHWCWARPADAAVAAALVILTFVQAVLRHRPRAAVIGPTNSGKSTLVAEVLTPLFAGPTGFAEIFDDATAAGVMQSVGCDSPPVVLDEFENSAKRDGILATFRVASRGGRTVRGTSGGVARETELRLLPWVLAIEPGDLPAQDRNRQIELELTSPPDDSPDPDLPPPSELHDLRVELVAAAVWAVRAAEALAVRIRRPNPPGVDRRLAESLAIPAAVDAVLRHGRDVPDGVARGTLETFLEGRTAEEPADTGRDLLDAVCSAPVAVPGKDGLTCSVGELVLSRLTDKTSLGGDAGDRVLALNGLRVFGGPRAATADRPACGAGLFVAPLVGTTLLKDSVWDGTNVVTVLKRLDGACGDTQAVNGRTTRGAFVPAAALDLRDRREVTLADGTAVVTPPHPTDYQFGY